MSEAITNRAAYERLLGEMKAAWDEWLRAHHRADDAFRQMLWGGAGGRPNPLDVGSYQQATGWERVKREEYVALAVAVDRMEGHDTAWMVRDGEAVTRKRPAQCGTMTGEEVTQQHVSGRDV